MNSPRVKQPLPVVRSMASVARLLCIAEEDVDPPFRSPIHAIQIVWGHNVCRETMILNKNRLGL